MRCHREHLDGLVRVLVDLTLGDLAQTFDLRVRRLRQFEWTDVVDADHALGVRRNGQFPDPGRSVDDVAWTPKNSMFRRGMETIVPFTSAFQIRGTRLALTPWIGAGAVIAFKEVCSGFSVWPKANFPAIPMMMRTNNHWWIDA
jgi:hypothetical protein